MSQFQDIIKLLDQNNIDHAVEIYIPSLKKSTKFCRFSGKHNKELINIITEFPLNQYHFKNFMLRTMQELCLDGTISIENLSPLDRIFICLQLRASSVSETYDNINLKEFISLKKDLVLPFNDTFSISLDNFKIELCLPTLKIENQFDRVIMNKIEKITEKTSQNYRQILADIFLINILCFIKSIKIISGATAEEIDLKWESLTTSQKIDVGYKLNSSVLQEIIEMVKTKYDHSVTEILQYTDKNGEPSLIDIEPNFFL